MAESLGWVYYRTSGDHMVFRKPGNPSNLSILDHREVSRGTLSGLIRTMGLTVNEFLTLAKRK